MKRVGLLAVVLVLGMAAVASAYPIGTARHAINRSTSHHIEIKGCKHLRGANHVRCTVGIAWICSNCPPPIRPQGMAWYQVDAWPHRVRWH